MNSDVCIIGAGIVGLATAYALAQQLPQWQLLILEKEADIACHQSRHNSGVLHSGIYYPPGSWKARLTRSGYRLLLQFCDQQNIPYRRSGKLIVATQPSEFPILEHLYQQGHAHGLRCELWDQRRIREQEPYCKGLKAIWVPEAGVVDFPTIAQALKQWLEQQGHTIATKTAFIRASEASDRVTIETSAGTVSARGLINCAGLHADQVARQCGLSIPDRIIPFRGEYYTIRAEKRFVCRGLIYPVPDRRFPFLGIHITRDIHQTVHCGPNAVLACAREGYRWSRIKLNECFSFLTYRGTRHLIARYWTTGIREIMRSLSHRLFFASVRRLIDGIEISDLQRNGSGVRAQLVSPDGTLHHDFVFYHSGRMLHVLNAPSPAATASFAIGQHIATTFRSLLEEAQR